MGLFDMGGGGGFDMDALMQLINPVGTANAQPSNMSIQPGLGQPGMSEDEIRNSDMFKNAQSMGPGAPMPGTGPLAPATRGIQTEPIQGSTLPVGPNAPIPVPRPEVPPVVNPGDPMRLTGQGTWGAGGPSPMAPNGQSLEAGPVTGAPPPIGTGPAGVAPDVGAALTGAAAPAGGTSGATDLSAQAKKVAAENTLAQALRGVHAPAPPVRQKISSPSPPRPTGQIKGGDLQALLMMMNAGAPNMGRQLPVTLGGGR